MFSAVSYSSRNKYLSTNDKIYSIVVQETQAKLALTEVAENIFQYNLNQEPNNQEEEFRASIQDRSTSTKDKVVPFWNSSWSKHKPKKDCFLGFIFPGNCVEIQKEIKTIFDEELEKVAKLHYYSKPVSRTVQLVLSRNEKKLGAIVQKSKSL